MPKQRSCGIIVKTFHALLLAARSTWHRPSIAHLRIDLVDPWLFLDLRTHGQSLFPTLNANLMYRRAMSTRTILTVPFRKKIKHTRRT